VPTDARALTAIVLLGFASGLPNVMVDAQLATWLSKAGWDKTDVILAGWVTLPYSLKVLWAPLVDRLVPPLLGRRRGWLAMAQLAAAGGLAWMAYGDPGVPTPLIAAAVLVAVAGATQDLAANAYAIEGVSPAGLGAAAGLQTWGWRAGALGAATAVPLLAVSVGWGAAYLCAAAAMLVGAAGTLIAPEPPVGHRPISLGAAVIEPLKAIVVRDGWIWLLAFVLFYRFSDGMASVYTSAFLAERYDLTQLSWRGIGGLAGAGLGAVIAGLAVARFGIMPCLWVFGVLQAASNLVYVAIAHGHLQGTVGLLAAVVVDNACATAAAAAFVAFLMARCTHGMAATHYALLTAIGLASPHLARLFARLPEQIGWSATFLLTVVVVVPGLALIPLVARQKEPA
jgi:MFS transporter, PAT family, beta-lactamase induction signal transducer AmpG